MMNDDAEYSLSKDQYPKKTRFRLLPPAHFDLTAIKLNVLHMQN